MVGRRILVDILYAISALYGRRRRKRCGDRKGNAVLSNNVVVALSSHPFLMYEGFEARCFHSLPNQCTTRSHHDPVYTLPVPSRRHPLSIVGSYHHSSRSQGILR